MMREVKFEEQVIDLLDAFSFEVAQDQDVLNVLCYDHTMMLDKKFNTMPLGEKDDNPYIIHYNLSFKPWKLDNVMYEEYFFKFANIANLTNDIERMRKAFTDDLKALELERFNHLKEMCIDYANDSNNYYQSKLRGSFGMRDLISGYDYDEDEVWGLAKKDSK